MFKRAKQKVAAKVAAIQASLAENKRIIRAAQMFMVGETFFGFAATVATVGAWLALGHPLIAVLCALGFVLGTAARFVVGVAAH